MRDILDKGEQLSWGVGGEVEHIIATIKFNPLTRARICGILMLMNPINDIQSPNADALAARTPFFSIIVPVYNVAPYLRECLDSVLAQTFTDWECLCVDDGSTDDSGVILDEYAQKDPRFRVFHKPNGGVSSARNLALDNAKGEWIWFVDGDDIIAHKALRVLFDLIDSNKSIDSVSFECIDLSKEVALDKDIIAQKKDLYESISYENYLRFCRGGTVNIFRSNKISSQRFKAYKLSEDTLFSLEYFFKCSRFLNTQLELYFRRLRMGSATRRSPDKSYVKDWLVAQFQILTLLARNRRKFTDGDWQRIVRGCSNSAYYTNEFRFFKLPNKEAKALLPLWLSNMKLLISLGDVPSYQRSVTLGLSFLPFIVLAKCCVFLPYYAYHIFNRGIWLLKGGVSFGDKN